MSQGNNGKKKTELEIIVGLGNPGERYAGTYHNAGAMAVLCFSSAGEEEFRRAGEKPFRYFRKDGTVFVLPDVYMNESGYAVKSALEYFGADADNLTLVHDDSDIETGNYKVSVGRGSAGHRGVKSTFEALRTENFTRIRIGVRGKAAESDGERKKAEEFVLKKIIKDDREKIEAAFQKIKTTENLIRQ